MGDKVEFWGAIVLGACTLVSAAVHGMGKDDSPAGKVILTVVFDTIGLVKAVTQLFTGRKS